MKITRVWSAVFSDTMVPTDEETVVIEVEDGNNLYLTPEEARNLINRMTVVLDTINGRKERIRSRRVQQAIDMINSDPELRRMVIQVIKEAK